MSVPELEKIMEEEREEFVRLYHTAPHELTRRDEKRLDYFADKIDFERV